MNMMFSVIVPVYNTQQYLEACVSSILAQDYKSYEIILVDDGSSDKSPGLCDRLSMQYPGTVTVIHQANGGQFCARAHGMEQAQGDYIVFVDADDTLEPFALSRLYETFSGQNVEMVIYQLSTVDEKGAILQSPKALLERGAFSREEILLKMFETGGLNPIVLKSFVRKNYPLDMSHRLTYGEDFYMSLMILDGIHSIWYEPTTLYRYRFNSQSVTHRQDACAFRDYLFVADYTLKYIQSRNLGEAFSSAYLSHFSKIIGVSLNQICLGWNVPVHSLLDELHDNGIVQRCKDYVRQARLRDRIRLRLFYRKCYAALILYEKAHDTLTRAYVSAKKNFVRRKAIAGRG